jgi:predicted RNase H-related nuclease YkuK (DUF458 family)
MPIRKKWRITRSVSYLVIGTTTDSSVCYDVMQLISVILLIHRYGGAHAAIVTHATRQVETSCIGAPLMHQ